MMATPAPSDTARSLLRGMLRIRMIEERIKALYAEQEMRCPTHFSIGQEAAAVGVCARLTREELITSAHRSHAHYLAKGGDLRAMLAELYGKVTGCARGKGGATETGVFHESLNFAAIHKLPIVMVCENNLYSVLTPLRWRHPDGREIAQLARGHGVATLQGDGNDADVVHALAGEAVEHARGGRGPVFVELATYRWLEHCGPNDDQHLGYRPPGEFAAWQARDPLKLYTQRLRSRGLVSDADLAAMTSAITAEIDDAVTFARSSPFPARQELAEHVYAP